MNTQTAVVAVVFIVAITTLFLYVPQAAGMIVIFGFLALLFIFE